MKTHNAVIYHCLCCGGVLHCESDGEAPECCGRQMVRAAAETVRESDDEAGKEPAEHPRITIPPVIRARQESH
jgi:hypothetical protein